VPQAVCRTHGTVRTAVCLLLAVRCIVAPAWAEASPVPILDVPFIPQSELLCGGAAAAMVLRYWGERGIDAASFSSLVDRSAAGIRTTTLVDDVRRRGWTIEASAGTEAALSRAIDAGRPVLALVEERRGTSHYVVIVGAPAGSIVFHDPARAPFRVMRRDEFLRRWDLAGRWMAIVVPSRERPSREELPTEPQAAPAQTPCEALVADGVARAQAGELDAAERSLVSALPCPGAAALRELAGLRVLQRRWPDAAELSRAALARDRTDSYAWQILATSEFVQDDRLAALDAWNAIGLPRVDLVRIDGLARTRYRPVARLLDIPAGTLLTPDALVRGRRRLAELPAASSTSLAYSPTTGGLAEIRATVVERPLVPRDVVTWGALGISATATRSIAATIASPTGGGEALAVGWRFWPGRPRAGLDFRAPAPFGGVWGVSASGERQPFDDAAFPTSRRTSAQFGWASWIGPALRVAIRGGVDRWRDGVGLAGSAGGQLRLVSRGDRVDALIDADAWAGRESFATVAGRVKLRSSTAREGVLFTGTLGAAFVSTRTPGDLWVGGDVGSARPALLRAHPIVTDGALKVGRLGRALGSASFEAQRWWTTRFSLARAGAAAFVDAADTAYRVDRPSRGDVDLGLGARFAVAGLPGVLRIDVAHGLRDGDRAISFVYAVE
jgi:hypothetical protein